MIIMHIFFTCRISNDVIPVDVKLKRGYPSYRVMWYPHLTGPCSHWILGPSQLCGRLPRCQVRRHGHGRTDQRYQLRWRTWKTSPCAKFPEFRFTWLPWAPGALGALGAFGSGDSQDLCALEDPGDSEPGVHGGAMCTCQSCRCSTWRSGGNSGPRDLVRFHRRVSLVEALHDFVVWQMACVYRFLQAIILNKTSIPDLPIPEMILKWYLGCKHLPSSIHFSYPMGLGTRMFQAIMDFDVSEVHLGDFNFQSAKVTLEHLPSARKAAEALRDPRTDFVQIGRCQPEAAPLGGPQGGKWKSRSHGFVWWFSYFTWTLDIPPNKSDDESSFLPVKLLFCRNPLKSETPTIVLESFKARGDIYNPQHGTVPSDRWEKKGDGVYLGWDQHVWCVFLCWI